MIYTYVSPLVPPLLFILPLPLIFCLSAKAGIMQSSAGIKERATLLALPSPCACIPQQILAAWLFSFHFIFILETTDACLHIKPGCCVQRQKCDRGINVSHQCSKLEHANPPFPFPAADTQTYTHTNTPLTPPLPLHKHTILLRSALPCTPPPKAFPSHLHAWQKRRAESRKDRKHPYCLLQSLMKDRNPSSEKKGDRSKKREEGESPAVASCRGIRSEEGRAGRGWRKKEEKEKKGQSLLQQWQPSSSSTAASTATRYYKVSGVPLHSEGWSIILGSLPVLQQQQQLCSNTSVGSVRQSPHPSPHSLARSLAVLPTSLPSACSQCPSLSFALSFLALVGCFLSITSSPHASLSISLPSRSPFCSPPPPSISLSSIITQIQGIALPASLLLPPSLPLFLSLSLCIFDVLEFDS